jgi:serine/threonine protein kinase
MGASRIAGRYELQEQLGEGGMGVVWRALDIKTGSAVAIKLMKDISDPVAVDLFAKEWRALAEISHPNIVEVRDVDVIEENRQKKPFFVMPLLRGSTLADLIANASARLTLERIVEITIHVCRGLQAAHQRGLIHRDLKPSNIFVMDDDTAKIIDFGVVHLAGSKSVTGQKGTFQYMSPEQAQLKEITPASDLFSMGVILYEALTRRKPFARKTAEETMEAVIKYIPPPVSELYPSINQSVTKVVHKCLAKQPIHRFTSARDLAETLQKAARNEPVFDSSKIEPRIERARAAYKNGDESFASEILGELESEGHLDPRISVLRMQIDVTVKQKKIRQLLESARARMEQDEIPLALDKVREVLEMDAQNPDALGMREAMEKQRSETQIARWLELAQTHLGNRDFGAARNAAQEVLAIRAADFRALDLLGKIESTEADARRVRDQKEQLYSSAMRAYQNGEIDSALGKLERLFSVARVNPIAAIPERDAVYQSFYKEVRSEHDSIHSLLEDAQRQFAEKNFAAAMTICRQLLAKYPNDGTFQALKIHIEDAERQELSSYIAGISQRLEAEPDLDRRVNIVREASERYPNETQFAQQLKLIRERRDLVNSIVAKARQYEERGQFAEAISQWDILRNVHPQYSGIAFELEQCRKKRDRQAREEEHSRLIEEIDGLIENRAFAKAAECAAAALLEFPGDPEISGLRTLAEQGLERTKESRCLFEQGQQALAEKDLVRATEFLRKSLDLDPRGPGLRDAVVHVLAERARALAEENWREAEPLFQEASALDATHPAVRALRSSITEGKRQSFVGQCLTECRALVAAGKPQEAAERIRAARAEYPNDPRLERFECDLQEDINEFQRKDERGRDRAALGENRRLAEQNPNRENLASVLEKSYAIRDKYSDDAEIGQTVADIELTVKRAAQVEDLSQLLSPRTVMTGTDGRVGVVSTPGGGKIPQREDKKGPVLVGKGDERTKIFEATRPERKESRAGVFLRETGSALKGLGSKALEFARPKENWPSATLLVVSSAIVLVATGAYVVLRLHGKEPPPPPAMVQITTEPADSAVTSDGKRIHDAKAAIGTTIEVSHPGYKPKQVQIQQDIDGKVILAPESVHLSIHTSETAGSVELDGNKIGDLTDGGLEYDINADANSHKLVLTTPGKTLFTVALQTSLGGQPQITEFDANDSIAVTSLANKATAYGGNKLKNVRFGNQTISLSPSGAGLDLNDQNHQLSFGNGTDDSSVDLPISNAPVLMVESLNAPAQVIISTNVENIESATLRVDGTVIPRRQRTWTVSKPPGSYPFTLTAEGYEPKSGKITVQRGKVIKTEERLTIQPKAIPMVAVVITGGTPEATVELDNSPAGNLDSNGSLTLPNRLKEGRHTVTFSKVGFDSRTVELNVKLPSDASIPGLKLAPSTATLSFATDVKNVTVKYRKEGDSEFRETNATTKVMVAPGLYEIVASAPGLEQFRTRELVSREGAVITLKLVSNSGLGLYEDPNLVTQEGDWFKSKTPGKFIPLKTGLLHATLLFANPGKTLLWDKKVEWLVEVPQSSAKVRYTLEGHKLTHKVEAEGIDSEPKSTKVDAQSQSRKDLISVHVRADSSKIQITNDKGATLDECEVPAQNFSKGRIAIRTDAPFLVRSDNP